MPTFRVVPDNRYIRKDDSHRYCLRAIVKGRVYYFQLEFSLTENQHKQVFVNQSMSTDSIDFREKVHAIETKAERIFKSMRTFEPERFKQLFYKRDDEILENDSELPTTLAIKELFQYYMDNHVGKRSTMIHMKASLGILEKYHPNLYVDDINVKFLKQFEKDLLSNGTRLPTISSYLRNLRSVINYFRNVKKIIPADFIYAFGQGGYSIKSFRKKKIVLFESEILSVIDYKDFDSPKQEYARNIWLALYYGSGINPIDLLKLRWSDLDRQQAHIIRTKTETTRQSEIQELTLPLTEEFKEYLNRVCDPTSPFVLGKLHDGYSETSLLNRKNRFRQEINTELKKIRAKLNLSAPLLMATARDCYASTLKRNGTAKENIGEMMGHADFRTTSAYLDSLSVEEAYRINDKLVKRKKVDTDKVEVIMTVKEI